LGWKLKGGGGRGCGMEVWRYMCESEHAAITVNGEYKIPSETLCFG
jgi:hypothetical protein